MSLCIYHLEAYGRLPARRKVIGHLADSQGDLFNVDFPEILVDFHGNPALKGRFRRGAVARAISAVTAGVLRNKRVLGAWKGGPVLEEIVEVNRAAAGD